MFEEETSPQRTKALRLNILLACSPEDLEITIFLAEAIKAHREETNTFIACIDDCKVISPKQIVEKIVAKLAEESRTCETVMEIKASFETTNLNALKVLKRNVSSGETSRTDGYNLPYPPPKRKNRFPKNIKPTRAKKV